jgi:hypothetical protein
MEKHSSLVCVVVGDDETEAIKFFNVSFVNGGIFHDYLIYRFYFLGGPMF